MSPPPRSRRCSAWSARSTWARSTWRASAPTCAACSCSAPTVVPVTVGHAHAQGRHQRDHSRLGDERAHDALHHRLDGGPASVPDHRARLPERHRARGARADPRDARAACRATWSRASAAARTRSAFFPRSSTTATCRLYGVEAGGSHQGDSATLSRGTPGVLHGAYSYLLQDDDGQVSPAHSIAAGLDYPGVGPEHSFLKDAGRVPISA